MTGTTIHRLLTLLAFALGVALAAPPAWALPSRTADAEATACVEAAAGKKKRKKKRKKSAKKKRRKGLGKHEFYVYDYRIRRGDTIGKLARRYGVEQEQLLVWNDLTSPHLIRADDTLTIYSKKRFPSKERQKHKVKPGETLGKIAKKYRMTVRELKGVNGIRRDLIHPGQRLTVLVEKAPEVARLGRRKTKGGEKIAGGGRYASPTQLTSGKNFYVKDPRETWGTPGTVRQLKKAFKAHGRKYRKSRVVVGDISTKKGGPLAGHRSHQRGIDVDIGYYRKGVAKEKRFIKVTPKTMDVRRTWALFHQLLKQGQVQMMFVDHSLQKPLYQEAKRRGASAGQLKEWFQYPRRKSARRGIIRHEPGHANHVHVRFYGKPTRTARKRGHRGGASK